jgi:hypothetical protein
MHLPQRIREQGMPVAVPPVDWEIDAMLIQFATQSLDEVTALLVDGADTVEVIVVFGDFQESFPGNRLTSKDIFQKRDDVIAFFRTAEGEHQDRIVGTAG